MGRYVIRRLLLLIPTVLIVYVVVFFSIRLVPGDVIDAQIAINATAGGGSYSDEDIQQLRDELGLNDPALTQFFRSLGNALRGDLGNSLYYKNDVRDEIWHALPVTLELALMAVIISVVFAIPFGALAALLQDTWVDYAVRLLSVGALSVPNFVVATLLWILPARFFGWTPPLGYRPFFDEPGNNLIQFILPAAALSLFFTSSTLRMVRSSMLEVLRSDYIRTAWSKGLTQRMVITRHALKNALIAPITLIGGQISILIGGTVIIETIFNLPGLGRLTLDAIQLRDYTQLQANVLFLAVSFIVVNLVVDLTYGWLDPRIRYK